MHGFGVVSHPSKLFKVCYENTIDFCLLLKGNSHQQSIYKQPTYFPRLAKVFFSYHILYYWCHSQVSPSSPLYTSIHGHMAGGSKQIQKIHSIILIHQSVANQ
jgi:hypothetical protein